MRVLMIAPEPFFEPRGTPISVSQRLEALSALDYEVDLLTYHVGEDITIPNVSIYRIPSLPFITRVKVGPSLAKVPLDILLFFRALFMLLGKKYDVVHTHEEAAFFGGFLAWLFRTSHLYDMHSSLPKQLENFGFGNVWPINALFRLGERWVLNTCDVVVTIGADLEEHVLQVNPRANQIRIENTAVYAESVADAQAVQSLRARLNLNGSVPIVYTGTFERYQGLDLLFDSLKRVCEMNPHVRLLMVGGKPDQVEEWRSYADGLGLGDSVHFLGTVSLAESLHFLELAAVLVSPRIGGTSVPLKIYSYLHAGKPIVATKLPAHTQLLDDEVAILAEPNAGAYAAAIEQVLADAELAQRLGRQAKAYAEREFTRSNYVNRLQMAYLAIKHARPIAEQKPLPRQHAVTRN